MEEQRKEWEMGEHGPFPRSDGEANRGKVSWVLEKGKRLLLTGFMISSAPLALPPLLVASAVGLVVSIPSAMFLASYLCSESLMRKLLPIPDDGEQEEREETEHKKINCKEEEEVVGAVLIVGEIDERESIEGPVIVEEIVVVEEVAEPENGDGEVVVEVTTIVVEEREIEGETKGSPEKIKDEGKSVKENYSSQETLTSKGDQSTVSSTTKDDQSAFSNAKADQSAVSTAKDDQSADKTTEDDQSAVTTASGLPVSQGTEETKDGGEVSSQTTPASSEAKKKKNVKKKPATQQPQPPKVMYEEEKIWEQIEGVRKILGYRVKPQKSTSDELKALYVFTGVEPPASFTEPSDLADVNRNLQFLKSIIGVN